MNEQPKRNSYLFFCRAFVLVIKTVDSRASKGSNLSKLMWSRLQERSINCLNFRIIILFSNLVPFKVLYSTRTLCRVSIYAFCMHSKVKRGYTPRERSTLVEFQVILENLILSNCQPCTPYSFVKFTENTHNLMTLWSYKLASINWAHFIPRLSLKSFNKFMFLYVVEVVDNKRNMGLADIMAESVGVTDKTIVLRTGVSIKRAIKSAARTRDFKLSSS